MTSQSAAQTIETLNTLRLPELWALFTEYTGEASRCPNRAFLIRRILTAQASAAQAPEPSAQTASAFDAKGVHANDATDQAPADTTEAPADAIEPRDVVKAAPSVAVSAAPSADLEVTSPRGRRSAQAKHQVLPVRFSAEAVEQLDAARERLGLPSRMALFRRALRAFLLAHGEGPVARLLERV